MYIHTNILVSKKVPNQRDIWPRHSDKQLSTCNSVKDQVYFFVPFNVIFVLIFSLHVLFYLTTECLRCRTRASLIAIL